MPKRIDNLEYFKRFEKNIESYLNALNYGAREVDAMKFANINAFTLKKIIDDKKLNNPLVKRLRKVKLNRPEKPYDNMGNKKHIGIITRKTDFTKSTKVLDKLGLNINEAVRFFLYTVAKTGDIPFEYDRDYYEIRKAINSGKYSLAKKLMTKVAKK